MIQPRTYRPPAFRAPAGATDTHIHFYERRFASPPGAPAIPFEAFAAQYRTLQQALGLARAIVVQPNAYGDDNRCTLQAMAALGPNAKGVAVVRADVTDVELERLTRAGVVAVRFMTLPGGALQWDVMDAVAARVHAFGWHANVQLDGRTLADHAAQILRLPGRFVIDHVGKFLEPVTPESPAFQTLLRLVDSGRCWVKLSAPYEVSKTGAPAYADVSTLARALVRAAPERVLWASNWPHPTPPIEQAPDDTDLFDLLLDWAPDAATRQRILVDNPAELYGFT